MVSLAAGAELPSVGGIDLNPKSRQCGQLGEFQDEAECIARELSASPSF
jgi:hypothetical protein